MNGALQDLKRIAIVIVLMHKAKYFVSSQTREAREEGALDT